ncbi:hypothetical protein GmHk_13G037268 [Glycine max]|nr:hypothetical protein GmHk_13G037268 [Glycine max]
MAPLSSNYLSLTGGSFYLPCITIALYILSPFSHLAVAVTLTQEEEEAPSLVLTPYSLQMYEIQFWTRTFPYCRSFKLRRYSQNGFSSCVIHNDTGRAIGDDIRHNDGEGRRTWWCGAVLGLVRGEPPPPTWCYHVVLSTFSLFWQWKILCS